MLSHGMTKTQWSPPPAAKGFPRICQARLAVQPRRCSRFFNPTVVSRSNAYTEHTCGHNMGHMGYVKVERVCV